MKALSELKTRLPEDATTRTAYLALEDEFSVAHELIAARIKAGLTQADVAARMGTTQSVIARPETVGGFLFGHAGHSVGSDRLKP